jgi:cell division protein FtsN
MSTDNSREGTANSPLIVVLSVLGVLAITLAAGLLLMQKQPLSGRTDGNSKPETASVDTGNFDPISWARESAEYPPLAEPEDTGSGFVADLNSEGVVPEISDGETQERPVVRKQPASVNTVKETAVLPTKNTTVENKQPVYREVKENAYWVQVIASSRISKAESIRSLLEEKGLPAHVMVQKNGEKTIYRVRLGAFSTKDEAENYAETVRNINGFSDSYVTMAPVVRKIEAGN